MRGGEKGLHPLAALYSRNSLKTAASVKGEGLNTLYSFTYIFHRQAARQYESGDKRSDAPRNLPVEGAPRPAALHPVKSIQQDCVRFIVRHALRRKSITDAKSLDDIKTTKRAAVIGRFVSMQLHRAHPCLFRYARHIIRLDFINEDAYRQDARRKALYDAPSTARFYITTAARIKVEPERKGPRLDRYPRIIQICNPANFDSNHKTFRKGRIQG